MPTYVVTAPDGRRLRLTGDSPPTESDLDQVFAEFRPRDAAPSGDSGMSETRPPETPESIDQPPPEGSQWLQPFRSFAAGISQASDAAGTLTAASAAGDLDRLKTAVAEHAALRQETSLSPVFAGPGAKSVRQMRSPLDVAEAQWQEAAIGRLEEGIGTIAAGIARRQTARGQQPRSVAMQEFDSAEGLGEVLGALARNPLEISASLLAESLPQMVPGSVGGAVLGSAAGPVGTAVGLGSGSMLVEYASGILESASKEGVDVRNAGDLVEFFMDPQKLARAKARALKGGIPVAAWDAMSGGLAGKLVKPVLKKGAKKIIARSLAEVAAQGAMGGAGEVSKALVLGEPIDWREVVAEVVAEIPGGAPEIMTNLQEGRKAQAEESAPKLPPKPPPSPEPAKTALDAVKKAFPGKDVAIITVSEPTPQKPTVTQETAVELKAALEGNQIVPAPPSTSVVPTPPPVEEQDVLRAELAASQEEETPLTESAVGASVIPEAAGGETITGPDEQKGSEMPAERQRELSPTPAVPSPRRGTDRPEDLIDAIASRSTRKIDPKLIREANPDWRPIGAARKLFARNGMPADVALQGVGYGFGVSPDMGLDAFGDAINAAAKARKGWRHRQSLERKELDELWKQSALKSNQTEKFNRNVIEGSRPKKAGDAVAVPVDDLIEGDKFKVLGNTFEVARIEYDDDGRATSVTLKDGLKYGVQTVNGGEVVHVDKRTLRHAAGGAANARAALSPETPFSLRPPQDERTRAIEDETIVEWAKWKLGRIAAGLRAAQPVARVGSRSVQVTGSRPGVPRRVSAVRRALEDLFGVRIVVVERSDGSPAPFHGVVPDRGRRVILIDRHTDKPVLAVAGHEILHTIRATDPGLYDALLGELRPIMSAAPKYQAKLNRLRAAAGMAPGTMEMAEEELIADFLGDNLADPAFWNGLANRDRALFERVARLVIDWINRMLERVRGMRGYGAAEYFDDLEAARNILANALRQYAGGMQRGRYTVAASNGMVTGPGLLSLRDDRNLVAAHNTTEDTLRKVLKVGGFAVPSVAVIRSDAGPYTSFGDITLVGSPEMVTPGRETKVLNADAYSPRYPDVRYFIDAKSQRAVENFIGGFLDRVPDDRRNSFSRYTAAGNVEEHGLRDAMLNDNSVKAAFLVDIGKLGEVRWEPIDAENRRYSQVSDFSSVRERVDRPDLAPRFKQWVDDAIQRLGVKETEKLWGGFTYSGRRRYLSHDLDTVVRMMKKGFRDAEGFNYGVGSVRAVVAKQFRTLKAIQDDRNKLVSSEQMDALKGEVDEEFVALAEKSLPYRTGGLNSGFGALDAFSDDMKALAQGGASNWKHLREMYPGGEPFREMGVFLAKLRELPSHYFEAKLRRAVPLDEFTGAVVPEGTPKDLVEALERRGLDVVTYPKGDAAARQKAVQDLGNQRGVMFSLRDTNAELNRLRAKPNRTARDNARITELQSQLGQQDLFDTVPTRPIEEIERDQQREKIAEGVNRRLVAAPLVTQRDMFGKPGQQEMFSLRDEPARREQAGRADTPLAARWIDAGRRILEQMPSGTVMSQWRPKFLAEHPEAAPYIHDTWKRVQDAMRQAEFSLSGEGQEAVNRVEAHAEHFQGTPEPQPPPVYDPEKVARWWHPVARPSATVRYFGGDALLKQKHQLDLQTAYQAAAVKRQVDVLLQQLEDSFFSTAGKVAGSLPKWARWLWPKKRMREFVARALPAAAQMHVVGGSDGSWQFSTFDQRAGFLPKKNAEAKGLTVGSTILQVNPITGHQETLMVGPSIKLESGAQGYQIVRPLSEETQREVYEYMANKFPEFVWLLDMWIDYRAKNQRVTVNGVEIPVFNRWSLGGMYGEDHPEFKYRTAYTPDVAMASGLVGRVRQFARDRRLNIRQGTVSPGRKYETGAAREAGNVHDLLSGWSIRSFQVLQEETRKKWMQDMLDAAADVPDANRPKDVPAGWTPLENAMDDLWTAFQKLRTLDDPQFRQTMERLAEQDTPEYKAFFGEVMRLRGKAKMMPTPLVNVLKGAMVDQKQVTTAAQLLNWWARNWKAGLLAMPDTWIENRTDNYLRFLMAAHRQFVLAVVRGFDRQALREARNLAWGSITNIVPGVRRMFRLNHQKLFERVVQERLPSEVFGGNTRLADLGVYEKDAKEQVRTLSDQGKYVRAAGKVLAEIGPMTLEAIGYGDLDIVAKQQFAFDVLLARAQTLMRRAGYRGKAFQTQVENWMTSAPEADVVRAVEAANRWLLDYKDTHGWISKLARNPISNLLVAFPLFRYHFVGREIDRATSAFRAAYNMVTRGKKLTPAQRDAALADTISYVMWPVMGWGAVEAAGAFADSVIKPLMGQIAQDDDDDDDQRQFVGARAKIEFDENGHPVAKPLPREMVTANRINISRIARQFGIEKSSDKDYWWHIKDYPGIRAAALFWLAAKDTKEFGAWQGTKTLFAGLEDFMASISGSGQIVKVPFKTIAEIKAEGTGEPAFTEVDPYATGVPLTAYLTLQALNLVPFQRQANEALKWVDPTPRRVRTSKSMDYRPGVKEALQAEGWTGLADRMVRGGESALPPQGTVDRRFKVVLNPRQITLAQRIASLFGQNIKSINRDEYDQEFDQ